MISKFPGTCARCRGRFPAGTEINYDRETKTASHEQCDVKSKATPEVRAAVVESRAIEVPADLVIPAPEGLAYREYQKAGIFYAMQRFATLNADDMGLGKTIQTAGIINATEGLERILIVAPFSLILNWKAELELWLVRRRTITVADAKHWPTEGIAIVTWGSVSGLRPLIDAVAWDLVVVDEAHYGKNPTTARTRGVFGCEGKGRGAKRIPPDPGIRANRRLALTGTPIENRPKEIFPVLHWLDPVAWPKFWDFGLRYCNGHQEKIGWNPATRKPKFAWDFEGESNLLELQQTLRSTLMVRRLKDKVLTELPPKQRQIIVIPAQGAAKAEAQAQMRIWKSSLEGSVAALEAEVEKTKASSDPKAYAAAAARLAQVEELAFEEMSKVAKALAIAKAPFVAEHVRDALEGGVSKVLIGMHHEEVGDALLEALKDFGPVSVTGKIKDPAARQAAVKRFQTDPTCRVFVGSIRAAGVGLTLTAAPLVVFAEIDWVPTVMSQFEDRAHRFGQTEHVLIQHVVVDGSFDCLKVGHLVRKQKIGNRALDEDGDLFPSEANQ